MSILNKNQIVSLKLKGIFGVLVLLVFSSCGEEERMVMPDPTDSSTKYNLPETEFVKQSPITENATAQWTVFHELKSTLASIPEADLQKIRTQSEKMTHYSDSLMKQIPASLETMPIKSRLDVVHSRLEMFNQTANKILVDSLELKNDYRESVTAFNILLHQINEKFDKDAIQITEDKNFIYEKQQRLRDSIFKVEKNRQKQMP